MIYGVTSQISGIVGKGLLFLLILLFVPVVSPAQKAFISKYYNYSPIIDPTGGPRNEFTEIVVKQDNLDMRGWSLRDNNASQTNFQTPVTFNNNSFWNNMRAGTVIVIWHRQVDTAGINHPADYNKNDGYIELYANNNSYFTGGIFGSAPLWAGNSLNIALSGDIIQLRDASGTHVHALGHKDVPGVDFTTNTPVPKLNHARNLASIRGTTVMICPGIDSLYYGWQAPQNGTTYTDTVNNANLKGLPNQCSAGATTNSDYWRSLRQPKWTSPNATGSFTAPSTINLDWTAATDPNPGNGTQGYIILRSFINSFTAPADGHTYSSGDVIGTATVVAVITSSQTLAWTDNYPLACGETVYYRVYAYRYTTDDINGNDYNVARGRAWNETSFAATSVSRAAGPTISLVQPVNPSCSLNNGSITVFATGGTGALQYSIDNGATWSSNWIFSSLGPGSYNILVRDAANCQTTYTSNPVILIDNPGAVITSVNSTNTTCGSNNGSITITSTGGSAPILYSIDNGVNWQVSSVFSNLFPGNYFVAVKDNNGCQTFYASNPVVISNVGGASVTSVVTGNATCGNNNGSIIITASGGTPPLSYSIDNGANWNSSSSFTGLAPGNYVIAVKDGNSCISYYNNNPVTITSSGGAVINTINVTNSTCGISNGSISVDAGSGTPPLQYSIDNGATWQASALFNGLSQGNYDVIVNDANNCQTPYALNPVSITNIAGADIPNVSFTAAMCGSNNGTITITAVNGTPPLEFSIDNGVTYFTANTFINLAPGNYFAAVRDANNCTVSYTGNPVTITNQQGPSIISVTAGASTCGNSNGSIIISSSGGTSPISYSIDNGVTWNTNPAGYNNLIAGTYDVLVKDALGCISPWPANPVIVGNISGAAIDNVIITDAGCNNNDGTIAITSSGGTNPVSFSIDNGATWSSSPQFTNLTPGIYNLLTRDANSCQVSYALNPVTIQGLASSFIDGVQVTDATCGRPTGEITLLISGMPLPIGYSIDNGATWQDSAHFTNLAASSYQAAIMGANNCLTLYPANPLIVNDLAGPSVDNTILRDATCGEDNGTIEIVSTGGTQPLSFSLDDGVTWQDSAVFRDLEPGSYAIAISDANHCSVSYSFNPVIISRIPETEISLSETNTVCAGQEIDLSPGNGFASYLWQDGSMLPVYSAKDEGIYWVTVTDTNGCRMTDSVTFVPCPVEFRIPTAFSPNLDGKNEIFRVMAFHPEKVLEFRMLIFNRWGQLIFETNSLSGYWDGKYKGLVCDVGLYSYIIEFRLVDGIETSQKSPIRGMITIIK